MAHPRLIVFFDTNVIYTKVASELLRKDVTRIISENSAHVDLNLEWHLPQVVIDERKFQMQTKAEELLPSISKVEDIIGHKLAVTPKTLELHINNSINEQLKANSINVTSIDESKVDLKDLISRSVERRPPFERGDKEKGFRDSIIADSFLQLCESSPVSPQICKLAFVTDDKLLTEYLSEKTQDCKNVRLLKSLEELETLINTLVSNIPEDFVNELTEKAEKIFFEKNNKKTLYYKEDVRQLLLDDYDDILNDAKLEGHQRTNGTYWIAPPVFVKKEKQVISWMSTVSVEYEVYRHEFDPTLPPSSASTSKGLLSGLFSDKNKKVIQFKGASKFEVQWKTNLSKAKNLTSPSLSKIDYIEDITYDSEV